MPQYKKLKKTPRALTGIIKFTIGFKIKSSTKKFNIV